MYLSAADATSIFKPSRRLLSRETATLYRQEKIMWPISMGLGSREQRQPRSQGLLR